MIRNIIGVIVGYVGFSIALFVMFTGLYLVLGASGSFQPGNYDLSWSWILSSFAVFFVGGIAAALVCGLIAESPQSALYMGLTLVVIGVLMAIMQIMQDPGTKVRDVADVPLFEAMGTARGPAWSYFISPIMGYFGAILGGKLRK